MSEDQLQKIVKENDVRGDYIESTKIASIIQQKIETTNIEITTIIEKKVLNIHLTGSQDDELELIVKQISGVITSLNLANIETLAIIWYFSGQTEPAWQQEFELSALTLPEVETETKTSEKSPWWNAVTAKVGGLGTTIGTTVTQASEAVVNKALDMGETITSTTAQASEAVVNTASGMGEAITSTTAKASKVVVNTASGMGETITSNAAKASQGIGSTAIKTGELLGNTAKSIVDNPLLERIIDQVDLDKAELALIKLQEKYPEETSSQIAHRLMFDKAMLASGSGLASSLLPGAAAALFALDLTAVAALQAEMVYQISGSYGFDLKKEERKSEVLAIFAIALGSSYGIKAGLKLLQVTPVVGAVVGVSANAAMIYSLGYAACKFYEAKLNQTSLEKAITDSAEASQEYLENAIAQEQIMDQILVYMWLAGNPNKSWQDLLPVIDQLNLSPLSVTQITAIVNQEQKPIPLESLLEQINQEFGVSLLAQCEQLAKADGIINDAEAKILTIIRDRLPRFT